MLFAGTGLEPVVHDDDGLVQDVVVFIFGFLEFVVLIDHLANFVFKCLFGCCPVRRALQLRKDAARRRTDELLSLSRRGFLERHVLEGLNGVEEVVI